MGGKFFAWLRRLFTERDPMKVVIDKLLERQRYHETESYVYRICGDAVGAVEEYRKAHAYARQIAGLAAGSRESAAAE